MQNSAHQKSYKSSCFKCTQVLSGKKFRVDKKILTIINWIIVLVNLSNLQIQKYYFLFYFKPRIECFSPSPSRAVAKLHQIFMFSSSAVKLVAGLNNDFSTSTTFTQPLPSYWIIQLTNKWVPYWQTKLTTIFSL